LNKTKLFEKIEIGWFSEESMRTQRNEFREFYREIVDKIMDKIPQIEKKMRTKIHKIENPKSKSKSKSKSKIKYIKNRTYKMKGGK
jgi:tRNA(Ile)-lysidine synthase TilS/MesJ